MTNPVAPPAAPTVPVYPALGSTNFNQEAYTYGSSMPAVSARIGAIGDAAYTNAVAADERAVAANNSAVSAAAQADAAMGYRNTAQAEAATATTKAAEADASAIAASKLNLGDKAVEPTTDNQGAPLRVGATYYDTTLGKWRVWTGSGWGAGLSINLPNEIHSATEKPTPADLDELGIIDSAAGFSLKKLTFAALKKGLARHRNKIINGKMEIAQRGASFSAIATGDYSLDRWGFGNSSTSVATASQQSDAPSSNEFQSSLRIAITTADTSIAAGDFMHVWQRVEGFNARDLIGRAFTLSFWVRSSKTGIHCVSLRNSGLDMAYVAEYTIAVANTWEYKTITVSSGLPTTGTWNWTNGIGLDVGWTLATGATYQTTANTWQTGNFLSTANQVNCLDTIGNIFAITGVQLEVGSVATPFEHRSYGVELALCKQYTHVANYYELWLAGGVANAGTTVGQIVSFPVPMRATPSLSTSVVYAYSGTAASAAIEVMSNNCYRLLAVAGGQYVVTGNSGSAIFNAEI